MSIKFLEIKLDTAVDNIADDGSDVFDMRGTTAETKQTLINDAQAICRLDNMLKQAKAGKPLSQSDVKWARNISF